MLPAFLSLLVTSIIGLAFRWWWTNHKRDKEIKRLEAEKRADIKIHAEMDKRNAESINPPTAESLRNKL